MTPDRPPCLLVVDDDPVTCARLEGYFRQEGYTVMSAASGAEMGPLLSSQGVDVVLLDVGLPGKDGLELARELRARDEHVGIILVTGRSDDVDKIVGLESGADDYVTKPFNSRELLARVKIVLRGQRHRPAAPTSRPVGLSIGPWTLDVAHRRLVGPDDRRQALTRGEFELLQMLLRHRGTVLSRERLAPAVSHRSWDPNDRSIDVLISRLREKVEDDARQPERILTVRGEGYLLASESEGA